MTNKSKKNNKGTSVLLTILIVICLGVLGYSGYKIISVKMNYKQAQDEYDTLRGYTHISADVDYPESEEPENDKTAAESDSAAEESDSEKQKTTHGSQVGSKKHLKAPITIEHQALLEKNSDYVGWLYIPALDLSYPIMQGEDDEYYLHHTFDGSYLFAGSLFINATAKSDFSDPHTLIYGHNMKDGSMFGMLRPMMDRGLYTDDPIFWVLTPDGDYQYRMFAMYTCMDRSDTYTIFSGHGEIVEDYIRSMKAKSLVDLGEVEYDSESLVVTLSTCVQAEGDERFVVQGVRMN